MVLSRLGAFASLFNLEKLRGKEESFAASGRWASRG